VYFNTVGGSSIHNMDIDDDDMLSMGRQRSNSAPPCDIPMPLDGSMSPRPKTKATSRSITVVARFRPENAQELANGGKNITKFHPDGATVDLEVESRFASVNHEDDFHQFRFDKVFPSYSTQTDLWSFVGDPVIENVFQGVNSSVLAYGQTGTGKTYTMMGLLDPKTSLVVDQPGLIPRLFTGIFQRVADLEMTHEVTVEINFVELYMERLYDLLSESAFNRTQAPSRWRFVRDDNVNGSERPEIRDGGRGVGMFLYNCRTALIGDAHGAMEVLQHGLRYRATAATSSNAYSSRSHAIALVTIQTKSLETLIETKAQLYLVDLAGSERVAKTEASGLRLDEATSINLSLHALGNVITALSLRKTSRKQANMHVPFRDSKLTRLLENSLGGNALTFVCLTVSPNSFNDQETLSTMRFGAKAKLVTTKPRRNQQRTVEELELLLDRSKAEVTDLRMQVSLLRRQLGNGGGGSLTAENVVSLTLGGTARPQTNQGRSTTGGVGSAANAVWSSVIRRNEAELTRLISAALTCPLTGRLFRDPVLCLDGHTYERRAISHHLLANDMLSPISMEPVQMNLLVSNQLIRSLVTMCNDNSLLLADGVGAPRTIFDVPDVLGVILDFLPVTRVLPCARVCSNFARAAYDKYRWRPLIDAALRATPDLRSKIQNSTLPAHKIYMLLTKGAVAGVTELEYLAGKKPVALYSSMLRSNPSKRHPG
jgi:hypothetical protein